MKPTAFIDSNVWIAGVASSSGGSARVLELCHAGVVEPLVSQEVLIEVDRNLRKKLPQLLRAFKELFATLRPYVCPPPSDEMLQMASEVVHPKDAAILAAALQAGVDYLVTLDRRHFGPAAPHVAASIRIVTPGELLNDVLPDR
ncbi:MAG: putative toxin-antitoxin system toxin component, PIN family [Armatimonadota bacterium]